MKFKNHENYNCEIQTNLGHTYQVYANWMHNENLDLWKDWQCGTGSTRIYIDKNLNVFNGECSVQMLGHALHGFELVEHTTCTKDRCTGCTDDLVTQKHEPR